MAEGDETTAEELKRKCFNWGIASAICTVVAGAIPITTGSTPDWYYLSGVAALITSIWQFSSAVVTKKAERWSQAVIWFLLFLFFFWIADNGMPAI